MLGARTRDRTRGGILALVAFVLAHNLLFLLRYGSSYSAFLERTGHGSAWASTVLIVAALATGLALASTARLVALSAIAGQLEAGAIRVRSGQVRDYMVHVRGALLAILLLALTLFVGYENVERVAVGLPAPGLGVLNLTDGATIAVFAIVPLLTALVEALYRWRRDVLTAQICAARVRWHRRARVPGSVDLSHPARACRRLGPQSRTRVAVAPDGLSCAEPSAPPSAAARGQLSTGGLTLCPGYEFSDSPLPCPGQPCSPSPSPASRRPTS